MRIWGMKTIPESQKKGLKEIRCDLCGKIGKDINDWATSCYEVNEVEICVTVRQMLGSNHPEYGMGTETWVDMCPDCFENKLVPWLREQGAKIQVKHWDW